MSDGVKEFGFGDGDEGISGGKIDRFKGKEGETVRASFVWFPLGEDGVPNLAAPSPRFVGAARHYIAGVGYVLAKGPEMVRLAGGPAKKTVATILAFWPTDRKGEIDKDRLARGDVDVKPWLFSEAMYDQLKAANAEWPFGAHDLKISCTDSQYQKMTLTSCRESMYAKTLASDKDLAVRTRKAILDQVDHISRNISGLIAQDVSVEKVREKLGGSPAASVAPETAAAVDDMLNDLLGG